MRRRVHRAALAAVLALSFAAVPPAQAQDAATPPSTDVLLERMKSEFAVDRLPAVVAAKEDQDAKLTKPLTKLLKDEAYDVRKAAMAALGAREEKAARKTASKALCARLSPLAKSPDHDGELIEVCRALHDLAQPSSVKPLIKILSADTPEEVAKAVLMAVANVPTDDAIEALIGQMSKGRRRGPARGQRRSAVAALRYATGEDERNDPDLWRAWWKTAKKSFDHEAAAARRSGQRQEDADREERKRKRREKGGKKGGKKGGGGKKKDGGPKNEDDTAGGSD